MQAAERQPDGSVILPGSFPQHDLVDLGIDLPESEGYSTVAGLVLDRLGHPPKPGEEVVVDGWRIEVPAVDRRAIRRLRLRPEPPAGDGSRSEVVPAG
ncbi:MAG: transporter associated domain-containing protein [Acidimicrobiia bacterium]